MENLLFNCRKDEDFIEICEIQGIKDKETIEFIKKIFQIAEINDLEERKKFCNQIFDEKWQRHFSDDIVKKEKFFSVLQVLSVNFFTGNFGEYKGENNEKFS